MLLDGASHGFGWPDGRFDHTDDESRAEGGERGSWQSLKVIGDLAARREIFR